MQDSIECTIPVNATEWHVHFKFERFYFERSNFNFGRGFAAICGFATTAIYEDLGFRNGTIVQNDRVIHWAPFIGGGTGLRISDIPEPD